MNDYTNRLQKIEETLQNLLQENPTKQWIKDCFPNTLFEVSQENVFPLTASCSQLLRRGGKRWRPLLLTLAADLAIQLNNKTQDLNTLKQLSEDAIKLTPVVEFSHTASLIHDDIEDNAEERRGGKAIHIEWGIDTAINSASWLYFMAESCIENFTENPMTKLSLYQTFTDNLKKLHLGQAMDIRWHRNPDFFPSIQDYKLMVSLKTGTLARLAAEIGMIAGEATQEQIKDVGKIATQAGIGFQILDDVLNLLQGNIGKKQGDDIVEGKKSLPILLFIKNNPEKTNIISQNFVLASKEGISSKAVTQTLDLLNKSNAVREAKEHGLSLINDAKTQLVKNYGSSLATPIVELFTSLEQHLQ